MKYQISHTASNPKWVDNYVAHHWITPIHNQLKATDRVDEFHVAGELKYKMFVEIAESIGISDIYLENNRVWVNIPETADTMLWMLKA
jgi:hypothetical protein